VTTRRLLISRRIDQALAEGGYDFAWVSGHPARCSTPLAKSVFPTFGRFLLLALLTGMIGGHDPHRRHPDP
jgi:hypothetical protein